MILINDNNPIGARGMARYFSYALDAIRTRYGARATVCSPIVRDYQPARFVRAPHFKGSEQISLHHKFAALTAWRLHPQVIYSAWYSQFASPAKQVFVVYDLIYERYPQYHSRWQTPLRNLAREHQRSLERADKIIAISQSTALDIVSCYPQVDRAKITVVPLGVDEFFFEPVADLQNANQSPYLLYVGFRSNHKNFMRLLQAYGESGIYRHCDLKVASRQPFSDEEMECLRALNMLGQVQLISDASEAELRRYYQQAIALVYPSVYEGFGLPILEAMAGGTLVATSNTSSMPEVGGDAAFYFDPLDHASMADTLNKVIGLSATERRSHIAAGLQQARKFTWQRCQEMTVAIIEQLLQV
ncbi:MAG TPA: glycosyltransferase family 1 protein [Anaerolineae bacterium]